MEASQAVTAALLVRLGTGGRANCHEQHANAEHQYYETICGGAGAGAGPTVLRLSTPI